MAHPSRLLDDQPAPDPGSPPPGVLVEQEGDVTRVSLDAGRLDRRFGPWFYAAVAVLLVWIGNQIWPLASWMTVLAAALLLVLMFGLNRLMSKERRPRAVSFTSERVWIDASRPKTPAFIGTVRTALEEAGAGEYGEPRPVIDSLPLGAVQLIRVHDYPGLREEEGAAPLPRLSIEADAGRLELVGEASDRAKLEWIRDYLEYRWSR